MYLGLRSSFRFETYSDNIAKGFMVELKEAIDIKEIKGVVFDRLRNNFYGYLITSLFLFNLKNIILILKSKLSIEITLKNILEQNHFFWEYFWLPILWGGLASLAMPVFTACYALIIGGVKAIRDDSDSVGSDIWISFKNYWVIRRLTNSNKKGAIEKELEVLMDALKKLEGLISSSQSQKDEFDKYIARLHNVYMRVPMLADKDKLAVFFEAIHSEGLLNKYPANSAIVAMVYDINEQLIQGPTPER